jgi:D-serine dehydratase
VYEVLKWAETLAIDGGLLAADDCRSKLLTDAAIRALLSSREVVVGSTGNLGLSVGLAAATLGMRCTVHMSDDAKAWKKSLLRQRGATVVEHTGNYSEAVTAGRAAAMADPDAHFVDDETSVDLFLGWEAPHSPRGCCRGTLRRTETHAIRSPSTPAVMTEGPTSRLPLLVADTARLRTSWWISSRTRVWR